jgi:hypothetical protein
MALLAVRNSGQPSARSQNTARQIGQNPCAKARLPYMTPEQQQQTIITARRPKRSLRLPARGCSGRPASAVPPMIAPTTAIETPRRSLMRIAV